jgi:hypothetical protein
MSFDGVKQTKEHAVALISLIVASSHSLIALVSFIHSFIFLLSLLYSLFSLRRIVSP